MHRAIFTRNLSVVVEGGADAAGHTAGDDVEVT
jgi:hypothetical protein